MMSKRLGIWAIGIAAMLITQGARANERIVPTSQQVSKLDSPAATVKSWLSQTSNLTQITGVTINPAGDGVEVILQTAAGTVPTPQLRTDGNTTTAEIPNAVLVEGKPFQLAKPIGGITSVTIEQLPGNRVKVAIVGQTAAPTTTITSATDRLIFSATAVPAQDGELEITVKGNRANAYRVPNASVTRTNTPIIDTPGSVQVIPRKIFQEQKPAKFSDALRSVAGAATNNTSRAFFTNTFIRGFDTSSVYLKNGIPDPSNILQSPKDLSNVERLEILSGPASIVGGQISPGGIINVVTKQPLATPAAEVSVGYGSFNTIDGAVDVSSPLNESKTVAARLNAAITRSDTVFNVNGVDSQRYSIAPVLSWQVSPATKLTFEGLSINSQYPQRTGIPAAGLILNNPNGKIPRNQFLGEPSFDGDNREFLQAGYDLDHRLNDNWQLRHAFRYSNLKLDQKEAFISALQPDLRTLERSADSFFTDINGYLATAYATGKFKTGNIAHELLVGIDYLNERDSFRSAAFESNGNLDLFNPVRTGVGALIPDSQTRSASTRDGLGIYVQDQLKIFDDKLIVVLGGRFDLVGASNSDLTNEPSTTSQRNNAFSPRVGILYKVANNVSLYGSYSQSFQQEIGRSQTNRVFDPSRGSQYELGVKADWLDNRLSTTLAFYALTKSNVLTADPADSNFSIQTGEERSTGIELAATGEILPGWNIIGTYAYTDARVTKSNDFAVGNKLANVPTNNASLWTTYTIGTGELKGLGFGLGLAAIGDRQGDLANSFQLPGYLRTDAAIFYRKDDWNVALNIKNLFGTEYIEYSDDPLRVYPGDPLAVSFSIGYKF